MILWFKRHWQSVFALFRYKNDQICHGQKYPKMSMPPVPDFEQFSKKLQHPTRTPVPKFYDFAHFLEFHHCGALFFGPYQTGSKMTKMAKSAWKSQNFANLSVLAKIMSLELRFDQFWAQSNQKKSLFWPVEKIWDSTIVICPNPKSGPFGLIWAPKNWSWSLFIQ